MARSLFVIVLSMFLFSCTASRWVVTDENAIDRNDEPVLLSEKTILQLESEPTVENPIMSFHPYRVTEKVFNQRVKTERTVQKYRPKWGFMAAGMTGALFTVLVANTSFIMPSTTLSQKLLLNLTGGILAAVSFTNMEPEGDPIFTGEVELMRISGNEIVTDSTRSTGIDEDLTAELRVKFQEKEIYSRSGLALSNGSIDVNLTSFTENVDEDLNENSTLIIELTYNETTQSHEVAIPQFLLPHATITTPVALLRNTPEMLDINVITEVGIGSSLEFINSETEGWYRVRFGGSEVFLREEAADIEWLSTATSGPATIVEFTDVPFGDIDVENSVPLLKQNNPNDRAIILSNANQESVEPRQYLDRDHRLVRFYLRHALQMNEDQIHTIEIKPDGDWISQLEQIESIDEEGSLVVYLSGFASMEESRTIQLKNIDQPDNGNGILTSVVFKEFERINPESLYMFVDLEFVQPGNGNRLTTLRSRTTLALQQTANHLIREIPNSIVIYSNRPGQSSSLYTGLGQENKRHHIFNYYLAEALKQRKTTMSELIRHLENNVDFTSRRLHDRPQEIQAFGNFTLNIAQ